MRDELLGYYERELVFLRQMGAEFARKYPKIASRLLLEGDKCEDPHVERLIEAFAFLAGRIRLKVDDEFPEITESFLNVLYPHYLAPIPSMAIVRFAPKEATLTTGFHIPRGTGLYSRPIQGTPCRFRTGYDTTVWPIEVVSASLESLDPVDTRGQWHEAAIKLTLSCMNDTSLKTLKKGETQESIDGLRFYLNGGSAAVHTVDQDVREALDLRIRHAGQSPDGIGAGIAAPHRPIPGSIAMTTAYRATFLVRLWKATGRSSTKARQSPLWSSWRSSPTLTSIDPSRTQTCWCWRGSRAPVSKATRAPRGNSTSTIWIGEVTPLGDTFCLI